MVNNVDVGVDTFITDVTRFSTFDAVANVAIVVVVAMGIVGTLASRWSSAASIESWNFSSGSCLISTTSEMITEDDDAAADDDDDDCTVDAEVCTNSWFVVCSGVSCFICFSLFPPTVSAKDDVDVTSVDSSNCFKLALAVASAAAAAVARIFKLAATWSMDGCFFEERKELVALRGGEVEVEQLGLKGDLGDSGCLAERMGLSTSLLRLDIRGAAIVTMGILLVGC